MSTSTAPLRESRTDSDDSFEVFVRICLLMVLSLTGSWGVFPNVLCTNTDDVGVVSLTIYDIESVYFITLFIPVRVSLGCCLVTEISDFVILCFEGRCLESKLLSVMISNDYNIAKIETGWRSCADCSMCRGNMIRYCSAWGETSWFYSLVPSACYQNLNITLKILLVTFPNFLH